jgi:hypothetical protein
LIVDSALSDVPTLKLSALFTFPFSQKHSLKNRFLIKSHVLEKAISQEMA